MKTISALLMAVMLSGCATMHRHPLATKLLIGSAGIAIGGTIGYTQRNHYCRYTYEGQPYYGTTCPAPRPDFRRSR